MNHTALASLLLAALFVSLFGSVAARADDEEIKEYYTDSIIRTLDELQRIPSRCEDCFITARGEGRPPTKCQSDYMKMYDKDTVEMSVVMGYMDDFRGKAEDKFAAIALREQVQRNCTGQRKRSVRGVCLPPDEAGRKGACGFLPVAGNDTLFEKCVIGPDGQPKQVRLKIEHSSVSSSHRSNMNSSAQAEQTRQAEETHMKCLREGHAVCLYGGHWRWGKGPSFGPEGAMPNRAVLSRSRESVNKVADALRSAPKRPGLVGYFACEADRLGGSIIQSAAPDTGVVLGRGFPSLDAIFGQVYASLDSALAMRCESEFNDVVNNAFVLNMHEGARTPSVRVRNFGGAGPL